MLDWKIADGEVVVYQTVMNLVDSTGLTLNFNDLAVDETTARVLESLASAVGPRGGTMTCSFLGQGRFLINEGRWEQFTAEMTATSTGWMEQNTTQQFVLTPLETVPPEYLELE